jgi:capsular exopolysaccharide synthesis family protein
LNKKVLIIGGDLRNPQLHSYTSLNKNVDGLTNYLIDPKVDWKSNVKSVFNKHFCHHILFSGSIPPDPTHLLANGNFGVLLKEARNHYDFIVVDLAPTLLVTDTILVSKYADVTLCVVRSNVTDKKIIPFSVELSKRNQLKNMAYVINAVDRKKGIGYNYGYEYTYGK